MLKDESHHAEEIDDASACKDSDVFVFGVIRNNCRKVDKDVLAQKEDNEHEREVQLALHEMPIRQLAPKHISKSHQPE